MERIPLAKPRLLPVSSQRRQRALAHPTIFSEGLSETFSILKAPLNSMLAMAPPPLPDPNNPQVEQEILNDAAHVFSDVIPLLGGSTIIFRLSILIGRLLSVFSNYLPYHSIVPDELLFQLPLLALSTFLVARSLFPIVKAMFIRVTDLDNVVFEQLFEPVDVNWWQFRGMLATCIDWEDLEPGHVLEDEHETGTENGSESDIDYLYWLYDGEVTAHYEGSFVTTIKRTEGKRIDDPTAVGLLADMRFLYSLDLKNRAKRKDGADIDVVKYPMATIQVGQRGAKVLRINSAALLDLMEHDEHLATSIRSLLLKSLQRKVGLLLRSSREQQESAVSWDDNHEMTNQAFVETLEPLVFPAELETSPAD